MQYGRLGPPLSTIQALELDGTISLYDPGTNQAIVLNETATAIWRLLDGQRTIDDVIQKLCKVYCVSDDEIRNDVIASLDILSHFLTQPTGGVS